MSDTDPLDLASPVPSAATTGIAVAAVALLGIAVAGTSVAAQAPGEAQDEVPPVAEIVMPEGQRLTPGPVGAELLPVLPTLPLPMTEEAEMSDWSALDAKLRATRIDSRLPSTRMYGVPIRPDEGPVSFGQTRGSWLSGGNRQLDGSSMDIFDVDLLYRASEAPEDAPEGPSPE